MNFVRKPLTTTFNDLVVYQNPSWNLNTLPVAITTAAVTVSSQPANGTYTTSQALTFILTFPQAITVTGTPRLDLSAISPGSIGSSNAAYANYASGSGTTSLTFTYTVQSTDVAPNGLTLTSPIDMNGGAGAIDPCFVSFTPPSLTGVIIGQNVYVTDETNNRVVEYTPAGSYVGFLASAGTLSGQVKTPHGIHFDSSGNIWIVDQGNNRIQEWNSSGTFLLSIAGKSSACTTNCGCTSGTCGVASGSGTGDLNWSVDLAFNASGSIWVTNSANDRLEEYNTSGTYVSTFGSIGSADGKLDAPKAIAIDNSGSIWVADASNNRVQKFGSSGTWILTIGGAAGSMCAGSFATATTCTNLPGHTACCAPNAASCTCASGGANGQFNYPEGVSINSVGSVWVDAHAYIQQFTSAGSYVSQFGSGSITNPFLATFDTSGNYWLADSGNNRIMEINSSSSFMQSIGGTAAACTSCGCATSASACPTNSGAGSGQLNYPVGVAVR